MPKKTISLSSDLYTKLDRYAATHQIPVSQVVQQALARFLGAPQSGSQEPEQDSGPIQEVQDYLAGLAGYVGVLRDYVGQNNEPWNQPPPPFPPPPWWEE